jgi:hypothetical protein
MVCCPGISVPHVLGGTRGHDACCARLSGGIVIVVVPTNLGGMPNLGANLTLGMEEDEVLLS